MIGWSHYERPTATVPSGSSAPPIPPTGPRSRARLADPSATTPDGDVDGVIELTRGGRRRANNGGRGTWTADLKLQTMKVIVAAEEQFMKISTDTFLKDVLKEIKEVTHYTPTNLKRTLFGGPNGRNPIKGWVQERRDYLDARNEGTGREPGGQFEQCMDQFLHMIGRKEGANRAARATATQLEAERQRNQEFRVSLVTRPSQRKRNAAAAQLDNVPSRPSPASVASPRLNSASIDDGAIDLTAAAPPDATVSSRDNTGVTAANTGTTTNPVIQQTRSERRSRTRAAVDTAVIVDSHTRMLEFMKSMRDDETQLQHSDNQLHRESIQDNTAAIRARDAENESLAEALRVQGSKFEEQAQRISQLESAINALLQGQGLPAVTASAAAESCLSPSNDSLYDDA